MDENDLTRAMLAVLDRMEIAGWVERRKTDAVNAECRLTGKGRTILQEIEALFFQRGVKMDPFELTAFVMLVRTSKAFRSLQARARWSPWPRHSMPSPRLVVSGVGYRVGGDEHHIVDVEADPERVHKVIHGDNFGCRSYFSAADPELTGDIFTVRRTPTHFVAK